MKTAPEFGNSDLAIIASIVMCFFVLQVAAASFIGRRDHERLRHTRGGIALKCALLVAFVSCSVLLEDEMSIAIAAALLGFGVYLLGSWILADYLALGLLTRRRARNKQKNKNEK